MGVMERRRAIIAAQDQFVPPEFTVYDYLQTSGHNARIDTGVSGDDTTLEIDTIFMPWELVNSYSTLFGNYKTENSNYCWRCLLMANTSSDYNRGLYLTPGNGAPSGTYSATISTSPVPTNTSMVGVKCSLSMSYGKYTLVGTITRTGTATTKQTGANTNNIAIGANNTSGTGGTTKFRIYSFKMKSHGKQIRNYIPVVRKSDSKAGFYDTVNCTFNPSIGTADFTAGNDT